MTRRLVAVVFVLAVLSLTVAASAQQKSPGAGPIIVLETAKGNIEIETYPEEAPKTVARVLELVNKNFYNGLRFHRAEPNFVIQVGDPVSRDVSRQAWWGRQGSGKPIGVAEITKKRRHVLGAVSMAYPGSDRTQADSQFFITRRPAPEFDGKYTVFGKVLKGMDVVAKIQRGDILKRAYLKDASAKS
ncbi:MAG TPA: peptidylprolyl isomerase [Vicinamibacterales bacterium]|nr:peptidylprolyl isomerase [Vicinamibacterales bacterium]